MAQHNYVKDKVVIITGAAGGFGALTAERVAEMGGKVVMADSNETGLKAQTEKIRAMGGEASCILTDVSDEEQVFAMAKFAIDTYGRIDVMVNNAGIMPNAYFSQHKQALPAWKKCIDICLKGTLYCICAVYDQMIAQGEGQIINISSIAANFPTAGSGIYQAAKIGIEYLSESLRSECQGKIKVTVIKPTGIPRTGLQSTVIDQMAGGGIIANLMEISDTYQETPGRPDLADINSIKYNDPDPAILAENIVYAINQPMGVSIGNLTVRASGENYAV